MDVTANKRRVTNLEAGDRSAVTVSRNAEQILIGSSGGRDALRLSIALK
jgi:hypothetical protein